MVQRDRANHRRRQRPNHQSSARAAQSSATRRAVTIVPSGSVGGRGGASFAPGDGVESRPPAPSRPRDNGPLDLIPARDQVGAFQTRPPPPMYCPSRPPEFGAVGSGSVVSRIMMEGTNPAAAAAVDVLSGVRSGHCPTTLIHPFIHSPKGRAERHRFVSRCPASTVPSLACGRAGPAYKNFQF